MICTRCKQERWPSGKSTAPYVCQRCREVLAGGNAIDPLPSAAQVRARAENGRSFAANMAAGKARRAEPGR